MSNEALLFDALDQLVEGLVRPMAQHGQLLEEGHFRGFLVPQVLLKQVLVVCLVDRRHAAGCCADSRPLPRNFLLFDSQVAEVAARFVGELGREPLGAQHFRVVFLGDDRVTRRLHRQAGDLPQGELANLSV